MPDRAQTEPTKYDWQSLPTDAPMERITRQRIIGDKMMISRVVLEEGFKVPTHQHDNEQIAVMLEGTIRFTIGEAGSPDVRRIECRAGDVLHLPSNVPHAAEVVERCVILDLFAPPSEGTGVDAHGQQ